MNDERGKKEAVVWLKREAREAVVWLKRFRAAFSKHLHGIY
jgi:succinate dehydrogenase/fumarate reductase flavoprotein subunit